MKRLPYIMLSAFLTVTLWVGAAERIDNIQIRYSASDFELKSESDGSISISSKRMATYPEGNEPGLPYFATSIAVPAGYSFESLKPVYTTTLVRSGIEISQTPIAVPTDGSVEYEWPLPITYEKRTYPESVVECTSSLDWSDLSVLNFVSSPFIYDAKAKELYFVENINIEVRSSNERPTKGKGRCIGAKYVKSIVSNSAAVEMIMLQSQGLQTTAEAVNPLDYLIVTSRTLISAYDDLLLWKRTKGLHAEIIAVEDIYEQYEGADQQEKIKRCLYDLHTTRGLKYVMLGGDDTIVPVRYCHNKCSGRESEIPADIYYACFGGNFEWNADGDDKYGELEDNINAAQSIYVTRIPVRTELHISKFSSKLIDYEKNPKWDNSILMAGMELEKDSTDTSTCSLSEVMCDKLYSVYIKPNWDGKCDKLFDKYCGTDFENDISFSPSSLYECISKGYGFIELVTHGKQDVILTSNGNYTTSQASTQTNMRYSIISTTACHSNAFDTYEEGRCDPCISESFIRNESNGILAYFGCSREGWYIKKSKWGSSMKYEADLYLCLFKYTQFFQSLGELAAAQKMRRQSSAFMMNDYNGDRWIYMGLNVIGDPEMPVYNSKPSIFNNFAFSTENGCFNIDTGEDDCSIEIIDCFDIDNKTYLKVDGVRNVCLKELPKFFIMKVSKEGFVSKYLRVCFIPDGVLSDSQLVDKFDIVFIGTYCQSNEPLVRITGKNIIKADQYDLWPEIEITDDAELEIE